MAYCLNIFEDNIQEKSRFKRIFEFICKMLKVDNQKQQPTYNSPIQKHNLEPNICTVRISSNSSRRYPSSYSRLEKPPDNIEYAREFDEKRKEMLEKGLLNAIQYNAVMHVYNSSLSKAQKAVDSLMKKIQVFNLNSTDLQTILDYYCSDIPVIVHFRPVRSLEKLYRDGFIRNFFELPDWSHDSTRRTRRFEVEGICFGDTYVEHSPFIDRIKYGCFNFAQKSSGVN